VARIDVSSVVFDRRTSTTSRTWTGDVVIATWAGLWYGWCYLRTGNLPGSPRTRASTSFTASSSPPHADGACVVVLFRVVLEFEQPLPPLLDCDRDVPVRCAHPPQDRLNRCVSDPRTPARRPEERCRLDTPRVRQHRPAVAHCRVRTEPRTSRGRRCSADGAARSARSSATSRGPGRQPRIASRRGARRRVIPRSSALDGDRPPAERDGSRSGNRLAQVQDRLTGARPRPRRDEAARTNGDSPARVRSTPTRLRSRSMIRDDAQATLLRGRGRGT
jgi:hypothetical protein